MEDVAIRGLFDLHSMRQGRGLFGADPQIEDCCSMGNFLAHGPNLESRTGAVLEAEVVPGPPGQPAVLLSFGYLPVFVRFPQDIVVPLDSTAGPEEARAWTNARRVLGSSIIRH